jgi:small subunit ribosomal protein S1
MNNKSEINDGEIPGDFEEMLESTLNRKDNFQPGDLVNGTVVYITKENIFVDISGKSEAIIEAGEFRDASGKMTMKNGDSIEGYVVSTGRGEIRITTSIGMGPVSNEILRLAYKNSIPVHGSVQTLVKGGYSIHVSGVRCFCPLSQIDSKPTSEPETHLGKTYEFLISEFAERGANIILSRRTLQDRKREQTEKELKNSLNIGDTVSGPVISIRDFGIFIDIGGIEAMVPRSELSWSRHAETSSFNKGDRVTALVKSIDWQSKKISLSIKATLPEPWDKAGSYANGQTFTGRVVNLIKNGAFVELDPGIDGFMHVSRISYLKKINKPEEVLAIGDLVNVRILDVNQTEKRISLELVESGDDPWKSSKGMADTVSMGVVEQTKSSGIHIRLQNGMLGFAPRKELLIESGADIQKKYPIGAEITVAVMEVDASDKKLFLSEVMAAREEQRRDLEKFMGKEAPGATTLGSLLKNKFENIQKKIDG